MPRAITRRCRGIAKAWGNICRHHAFPAISPFFILGPRLHMLRTPLPPPQRPQERPAERLGATSAFWVWLASVGAGGAVLGLLAAFLIVGRCDAREFGQYPQVYCTSAGGQVVTNPEGRRFCAIWIDRPPQSGGLPRPCPLHGKSTACHKHRRLASGRDTGERP